MAFSAAIFGISLGLCGLNLGALQLLQPSIGAPTPPTHGLMQGLRSAVAMAGIVEIVGMAIGAAGIALSILGLLIQLFWRMATRKG
jgi:hypothetical protein